LGLIFLFLMQARARIAEEQRATTFVDIMKRSSLLECIGVLLRPRHVAKALQVCKKMRALDNETYWARCAAHAFFRQSMAIPLNGILRFVDGDFVTCLYNVPRFNSSSLYLTNLRESYKSAIDSWIVIGRNFIRSVLPEAREIPNVSSEFLVLLEDAARPDSSAVSIVIAGDAMRSMSARRSVFRGILSEDYDTELRCMKAFFRRELSLRIKPEIGGLTIFFEKSKVIAFLRFLDDDSTFSPVFKENIARVLLKELFVEFHIWRGYRLRIRRILRKFFPKFCFEVLIKPSRTLSQDAQEKICYLQSRILESNFYRRLAKSFRAAASKYRNEGNLLLMCDHDVSTFFLRQVKLLFEALPQGDEPPFYGIGSIISNFWNLPIEIESQDLF
jgi:hypothetical protein